MKTLYHEHEVEGTVDEIKELLNKRKYNIDETFDTFNHYRTWTPKEERQLLKLRLINNISYRNVAIKLNKTIAQIKDKIMYMKNHNQWHINKNKKKLNHNSKRGNYFSSEQRNYILKSKKHNVSYKDLTDRFNKKFKTNCSRIDIELKYKKIKK